MYHETKNMFNTLLYLYKDYSFTALPSVSIIHSQLYILFPSNFRFHFSIFGLQDLTKESLVGFPSVKVIWLIPHDFWGMKHYVLPTQGFIHLTKWNLCFWWQMQPVLQWAVPSWASGNPSKGLQGPHRTTLWSTHTEPLVLIFIFSRMCETTCSSKQYVRGTVFGPYDASRSASAWKYNWASFRGYFLQEESSLSLPLMWPWSHS